MKVRITRKPTTLNTGMVTRMIREELAKILSEQFPDPMEVPGEDPDAGSLYGYETIPPNDPTVGSPMDPETGAVEFGKYSRETMTSEPTGRMYYDIKSRDTAGNPTLVQGPTGIEDEENLASFDLSEPFDDTHWDWDEE